MDYCSTVSAILCLFGLTARVSAEEFSVAPMKAEQQTVLESIEQGDVLATVSFLASDEMGGRNTPSPELEIAAAYVASRFRGAGLEGLGHAGSFFQSKELPQFVSPKGRASVSAGGEPVKTLGVLFSPQKAKSFTSATIEGAKPEECEGKIVLVDDLDLPPQTLSNPAFAFVAWSRRLQAYVDNKAVAALVRVSPESALPEFLNEQQGKPLSVPGPLILDCPVIVIPAEASIEGDVTIEMPGREESVSVVRNVIGVLRGSDPELSKEAIIVSAHLDHIGRLTGDRGGDSVNNGADDNATGVTAVVMLADAFGKLKTRPRRSMIFMTFWGEEKGLLGSKHYCESPCWPLEKTIANINIEMIGRPEANAENKMWGTGWTHSTLCDQISSGAKRVGIDVFYREDVSEMLYKRSDNYSFVQKGVIAHSFSAGSLHSDYHQPSDEVALLNLPHMTEIIKGLFAGTLPIADGELTPTKSAESK